jgi:glutamate-1-semialdehyde 2,1-aminomutase
VTAGLATLRFILDKKQSFYSELEKKCKSIAEPLKESINDSGLKVQISQVASMFQLFFTDIPVQDYSSVKTADNSRYMEFQGKLLKQGVFVPPSQFETCFISWAHSEKDLERTAEAMAESL